MVGEGFADPATRPAVPAPAARPGDTVLVIDDDPAAREVVRQSLIRRGFKAETAGGGREGLEMARRLRPLAITLDVVMPDMDGWSVLAALKADPELADVPVVMLTMVDEQKTGFRLGAADYLMKPIDSDRLATVLRKYRNGPDGRRVLLVDDDADLRQRLRDLLEKEGWTVDEAADGQAALTALADRPPALVLLDLLMPGMDGFEFLAEFQGATRPGRYRSSS